MAHIRDYPPVRDKVRDAPLTLTEADFLILHEFGGPRDEQRGRDALKRAQLRLLDAHSTLQTKAAPVAVPATLSAERDDPSVLLAAFEIVMRQALAPVVARLRALETKAANVPAMRQRIAAPEAPLPVQFERQVAHLERQLNQLARQQLTTFMDAIEVDRGELDPV